MRIDRYNTICAIDLHTGGCMIRFEKVSKTFETSAGDVHALSEIDLNIEKKPSGFHITKWGPVRNSNP